MKNLIATGSLFLFCILLAAQDKTIDLSSFEKIEVQEGIEVTLLSGSPKAEVYVKKGDIEDFVIKESGGEVELYFKKTASGWFSGNDRDFEVTLYYDSPINRISVSSGASIDCDETLKPKNFRLDVSSGASAEINVEASDVRVDVSSGASVELNGEATDLEVNSSSGATFNGKGLKATNVDVDASSGASAKVWATKGIKGDASSGASIKYKGDPMKENLDSGRWSGGSISKM